MAMEDDLVLRIEANSMSSGDLGRLLVELGKAYSSFTAGFSDRTKSSTLQVAAVRAGSIEVVLTVDVAAFGQLLAPFATHLGTIAMLALGIDAPAMPTLIKTPERNAVQSMAKAVAKGKARQISIVNQGNVVFNIQDAAAARTIIEGLQDVIEPDIPQKLSGTPRPTLATRDQITQLRSGSLMGTAFLVDGTWYARLEGSQGVLVPLTGTAEVLAPLQSGNAFRFGGRAVPGSKGETIGFYIEALQPLP